MYSRKVLLVKGVDTRRWRMLAYKVAAFFAGPNDTINGASSLGAFEAWELNVPPHRS